MSTQDNGGPAFPTKVTFPGFPPANGMTLRDYFAAHASEEDISTMLARIPRQETVVGEGTAKRIVYVSPQNALQIARYMHADAMLEARKT